MDIAKLPLDLTSLLALAAGLGWASGIRLYGAVFVVGLAGRLGWIVLPEGLRVLEHPWVLGAAGLMLLVEFLADKVPVIDSLWDSVHTFIRIPAGAALAGMAFGGQGIEWQVAMALLGGTFAAGTHFTKASGRAIINTTPEPFSNIGVSIGEDVIVITGLWLIFAHPAVMLGCLLGFAVLVAWLLPKCWRGAASIIGRMSMQPSESTQAESKSPGE
ncbi:MAG: DUF4126 domain-containing protein [Rhodocyclaceae bacterium]|nr:MAG: DUF4126 domain-containing protein [Rhodocyclaceae bacterium]